ncbi:MAG: ribosome biosis GTPase [Epulopiscium sp.]|uniref:ribosome biogenesis GTPase YlqF n=1 Tax=Defluviitalea raffinosedens TaxID=1450156 RepID=UPI001956A805|nr:ribosome biogenesis GTPase YlqF [Defluviitalea raffinosedens]MBZ4669296.1 ribosome biosis GTP-binding protein YlqF [Defluviitaleaceae bacterium]MDK2788587.1 ribosome biosis GTPase [Candidatus Epulonipiscium sp.]
MNIQWYPGHMTKTRRLIIENLKLVDIVIELVDARIPFSSKNPDIEELSRNKPRILVMNKSDLADPYTNSRWISWFEEKGYGVITVNSITGKGISEVDRTARELLKEKIERDKQRGRIFRPIRAMVVGIPNVGKSTFINKLAGKSSAKTGDRPGVTKGKQWIKIKKDFELLDTPGILWPKFEDMNVGMKLAFTGAIKQEILDTHTLSLELLKLLSAKFPDALVTRYKLTDIESKTPMELLTEIGQKRGFLISGGEVDYSRTSLVILDELRAGKLGNITLESPEDIEG